MFPVRLGNQATARNGSTSPCDWIGELGNGMSEYNNTEGARSLTRRGVLVEAARATAVTAGSTFAACIAASAAAAGRARAGEPVTRASRQLTDGQAKAVAPIAVFILAGQSNMEGHGIIPSDPARNGGKGSLEFLAKNPATASRFAHLLDPATGKWQAREDVFISYLDRKGALAPGFGARPDRIGPEMGFGWVMGNTRAEPVLLIKCAWGGKSLALDFRPPSAGKPGYSFGASTDGAVAQDPTVIGKYYRETLALTKAALSRVKELVPGSDGRYELAGFGWHQGWNDRIHDASTAEYASNMAHFIRDMRRDLGSARLPFVIAETGMGGLEEKHPRALALMRGQASVAEMPEFKGNVAFVGTRAFWRPAEESPTGQSYHWNSSAETYYLIGEAMGEAMKRLATAPAS